MKITNLFIRRNKTINLLEKMTYMENNSPKFSVIIPVYNRPQEVEELLESLSMQKKGVFETIIVEDGSSEKCEEVCKKFASAVPCRYYYKENGGPAEARNFGASKANGQWLLFFDSDCILPEQYMEKAIEGIEKEECQLFGGADRSHPSFTTLQKAIDYSMTSIITTGGIRGNKRSADKFYPRTFNMGIQKKIFEKTGGFSNMRFGEDVDFSYKVKEGGYSSKFISDAWVYHKRRNTIKTFFKQVLNSGIARVHLTRRHPGTLKLVHLLPTAFFIGTIILAILATSISKWFLVPLGILGLVILIDATIKKGSVKTGIYSIITSFTQLYGYGLGLIMGWWNICILKKEQYAAFVKNFYK